MRTITEVERELSLLGRMIAYAEAHKTEKASQAQMLRETGLNMWMMTCCYPDADCETCILAAVTLICDDHDSHWMGMVKARTWAEFLSPARNMRDALEKCKRRINENPA